MKKTLLFSTLSLIAFAIVFSSCSQLRNFSIEKRHYNKGFYVHTGDSRNSQVVVSNHSDEATATSGEASALVAPRTTQQELNDEGSTIHNTILVAHPFSAASPLKAAVKAENNKTTSGTTPVSSKKNAIHLAKKETTSPIASEANIILLVILCFLLPWLAVLLKEGGITTNFWIALLLWFLFILPGVIFALLVVFDVI